jgi:hypothetical protein
MATWYYKGTTPAPVEIPGRGSVVIRPKSRFEAPITSVSHLVRSGLVVEVVSQKRATDPVDPPVANVNHPPPEPSALASEAPQAEEASVEEKPIVEDVGSDVDQDVVGSASQAAQAEVEAGSEDGPGASPPVEQKEQSSARRRRRRS